MLGARAIGTLPLLLCACGRFGFGAPSSSPSPDAGTVPPLDLRGANEGGLPVDVLAVDAAPSSCADLPEDAPCDDDDICTAASRCRGGACVATSPAGPCVVADSRREFSDQQGADSWWYGYWHAEVDPDGVYDPASDFVEMVHHADGDCWRPPDYSEDAQNPGYTWAYLAPYWEHPGGGPRARKTPVRRWVSDVSGPAVAEIHFLMQDDNGGDGVTKSLLVDGVLVWTHHVDGTDGTPVDVQVPLTLHDGARVDFLLDAGSTDAQDTTEFWVAIGSP